MTSVAIWFEEADRVLWAVGDTRTSNDAGGALSEASAKIFPLTLRCRVPGTSGFFDRLALQRTLGFAFAGSTFAALQTYSAANAALQHMVGMPGVPLPSLMDIAQLLERIGSRYLSEVAKPFEMAVFGCCPAKSELGIIHLSVSYANSSAKFVVTPCQTSSGAPLLLGTHRDEIAREIAELDSGTDASLKRTPKRVLRNVIASSRFQDIGGTLQIGSTRGTEFELMAYSRLTGQGTQVSMIFLGLDIDTELGLVGGYKVAPIGII